MKNDNFDTVENCRQTLLHVGDQALHTISGDETADQYKKTFGNLMKEYERTFPRIIFADIKAEVVAHLRLKYGAILMNWLLADEDTADDMPF